MKKILIAAIIGFTACVVYASPPSNDNDVKIAYSVDDNFDIAIAVTGYAYSAPVSIDEAPLFALSSDDGNGFESLAILETTLILPETVDHRQRYWREKNIGEPLQGFKIEINKIPLVTYTCRNGIARYSRLC